MHHLTIKAEHSIHQMRCAVENNPDVMNELGQRLGLSSDLAFHDVYSLDDPSLLAIVPRPVHALLVIIPMTDTWKQERDAENERTEWYGSAGHEEPVIWFHQTIINGCGLIGFLHCAINGVPATKIIPDSTLATLREEAIPLKMKERAELLSTSDTIYEASQAVAVKGDTAPLEQDADEGPKQHFVAFVKGSDGNLWELEGSRKGPIRRGALTEDQDALSEEALQLGLKRVIELQKAKEGEIRFSCIALAPREG
ncbi:putative ubiquitin carboxyl-terminal hydrolase [Dactylonectria macrodidyma]|uniref:Ubiquitin carboxyl-terminal hydrolase n=1 Tax=Dactylonectria macrodidyma TaxID=307937 RepID=A0A9P9ETR2_9HYPO|nr:putative ubiquitin carboxyl-terminal hydrolase [Dactylonectria macrodidyma]